MYPRTQGADWATSFYMRDLSNRGFRYLQGAPGTSPPRTPRDGYILSSIVSTCSHYENYQWDIPVFLYQVLERQRVSYSALMQPFPVETGLRLVQCVSEPAGWGGELPKFTFSPHLLLLLVSSFSRSASLGLTPHHWTAKPGACQPRTSP